MAIITSSPDAWSPLATDLTKWAEDVVLQRFEEPVIDGRDLEVFPPELDQMIQLAQIGWGAQLGSGERIGYWAAVALIQNFLTAHIGRGVPTRGQ
jgi:hypothetical protein